MQKCSQCGEKTAIEKYRDNYLCLDCLKRLSNIHNKENEQRHREVIYGMQMANAAENDLNNSLGCSNSTPPFDLNVFNPSINIKYNNINVNNSVVGNISTDEVCHINISLQKINSGGDTKTAEAIKELTNSFIKTEEFPTEQKNEVLEQISLLSEQASLQPQFRKTGIIKAVLSSIKDALDAENRATKL